MRGSSGLHRWVLLNNSITRSQPLTVSETATPDVNSSRVIEEYEDESEEETDSFLFPDAGKLIDDRINSQSVSEAEWLDSLLESLTDQDGREFNAEDDDEDLLLWPLLSPISSSEDLTNPSTYYPPITFPYPVPYPPCHQLNSHFDSPPTEEHDVDDLSVPDAIEDTSDDESDTPSTPSLPNSTTTSSLVDPASIPLPRERRPRPHIYINTNDDCFYPFGPDPLPFPEDDLLGGSHVYEEC
jgi:hypothetical protein